MDTSPNIHFLERKLVIKFRSFDSFGEMARRGSDHSGEVTIWKNGHSGKCPFEEVVVRGGGIRGNVYSRKWLFDKIDIRGSGYSWKCPRFVYGS